MYIILLLTILQHSTFVRHADYIHHLLFDDLTKAAPPLLSIPTVCTRSSWRRSLTHHVGDPCRASLPGSSPSCAGKAAVRQSSGVYSTVKRGHSPFRQAAHLVLGSNSTLHSASYCPYFWHVRFSTYVKRIPFLAHQLHRVKGWLLLLLRR
jgi:hypothetical protein